jgi:hypothetical protein
VSVVIDLSTACWASWHRPRRLTLSRPLDCLTTGRLEWAGVVQIQQADNAHYRRVLADAESLAWKRVCNAEWHAALAALEAMLRELAPAVFNDRRDFDGHPTDVPADSTCEFAAVLLSRRGGAS